MITATSALPPRTKNITIIAQFFAALLLLMAVGQLFSFEKFIPLLKAFNFPGGDPVALFVATAVVVSEIFAVPFLLQMKLSPLMRMISMICSWVAVALWFLVTVWVTVTKPPVETVGLLGASVDLPVGWWAVLVVLALAVLAVWTTWGLWPYRKSHKQSSH